MREIQHFQDWFNATVDNRDTRCSPVHWLRRVGLRNEGNQFNLKNLITKLIPSRPRARVVAKLQYDVLAFLAA